MMLEQAPLFISRIYVHICLQLAFCHKYFNSILTTCEHSRLLLFDDRYPESSVMAYNNYYRNNNGGRYADQCKREYGSGTSTRTKGIKTNAKRWSHMIHTTHANHTFTRTNGTDPLAKTKILRMMNKL
jgi:hypothetical protein